MATRDESSVDVDFAVCSYKKECFYFISRGMFSLYNVFMVCYRNFKTFVQRYSWIDDIEGNRELFKCKKKERIKVLA